MHANVDTTTLITGATSGIGRAVAHALAATGRQLLVAGREETTRERVIDEVVSRGGRASGVRLDLHDDDLIDDVLERVIAHDGRIELVNAAGTVDVHDVLESGGGASGPYARMLREHFDAPRRLMLGLLPAMLERGGATVHVASAAGLVAYPRIGAYVTAKHALLGFTRAAAFELEGTRASVAAVCPYYVDTPMMERGIAGLAEELGCSLDEARRHFGERNPGGRWIEASEVADAIVELLCPGANGRLVVLDGGPGRPPNPLHEP